MKPNVSIRVAPEAPPPANAVHALPLAVDLDNTLLLTDTLFEGIAEHFRRRPLWTLKQLVQLPFSIAKVKARLQRDAVLDIATLPANEEVLSYCLRAKASGRKVWLVSAADQLTVDRVAARFGVFDRAIGSDGDINNKGASKAKLLEREAPEGFEYLGDSPADYKVWARAKIASHVGGGTARTSKIESLGAPVARAFERPRGGLNAWRKAMRLHQWAKNALIFVPAMLAMKWTDATAILHCALALPLLGVMASGTYIANDLLDLKADRHHHTKRNRPFASGQLKLWQGFVAAPAMILAGFAGGLMLSPAFAVTMLSYLTVTLTYSLKLKRMAMLDTMALAFLYTLRLVMGGVLAGVGLSQWLVIFSMFLFVSLSLAKRHVEVIRRAEAGERRLVHRGYRAEDAGVTLGLGLATATASPLILVLYIIEAAWPSQVYSFPPALWVAPVVLSMWLMRLWLLANRGELDDDPVVFAIKDRQSLAMGAAIAMGFGAAAFAPANSLDMVRLS
ncbi:MAG TPA: UbiA family prenyltransferase [Hyphomonadaceae bacterium]|nr:UbiA family prenyltransferase [Hyphomonadaceae bacterium]